MTDASQSPGPSLLRRALRATGHGVGWLLRTLCFALLAIVVVLSTDWGKDRLRDIVVDVVNGAIQGTISVGSIRGSVVGDLTLTDVVVDDPDGLEVLRVDAVVLDYDLGALLDTTLLVERLHIDTPHVLLANADGTGGIAAAFSPTTPAPEEESGPSPVDVVVESLELSDGRFALRPGDDAPVVDDIDVSLALSWVAGDVEWSKLDVAFEPRNLGEFGLAEDPGRIRLASQGTFQASGPLGTSLTLEVGDLASLDATASLQLPDDDDDPLGLDLKLDALTVNLDRLSAVLPEPEPAPGSDTDVDAGSDDATARRRAVPATGEITLSGSVSGDLERLALDLSLDTMGGTVAIEPGSWFGLVGGEPRWDARVSLRDGEPAALLTLEKVPGITGLEIDIHARGRGNPMVGGAVEARVAVNALEGIPHLPEELPLVATAALFGGDLAATVQIGPAGAVPTLDARVAMPLSVPEGESQPIDARVAINGFDVTGWARVFGMRGAGGHIEHLDLAASLLLGPDGGVTQADTKVSLRASQLDAPLFVTLMFGAARVTDLAVDADLSYPGEGLPTGRVALGLGPSYGFGVGVDGVELNAELAPGDEAGWDVDGNLDVRALFLRGVGTIGRIRGDFVAAVSDEMRLDPSTVALDVRDVDLKSGLTVDRAEADLEVSADPTGDALAWSADGRVSTSGLNQPGAVRIGSASGRIDAEAQGDHIDADVDLTARNVRTDGQRVARARVQASASIDLPITEIDDAGNETEIRPLSVASSGRIQASGIDATEDVSVASADARFDIELRDGAPQGDVSLSAKNVTTPMRNLETADMKVSLGRRGKGSAKVRARAENGVAVDAALDLQLPLGGARTTGATVKTFEVTGKDGDEALLQISEGTEFELRGDEIRLRNARISAGDEGRIVADLDWAPSKKRYFARFSAQGIRLRHWLDQVERITGIAVDTGGIAATIDVEGALEGRGSERPRGELHVNVYDGSGMDMIEGLYLEADAWLDETGLLVSLDGDWGENSSFQASAEVPGEVLQLDPFALKWTRDTAFEIDATLEGVDLGQILQEIPAVAVENPAGVLSGHVFVDGTLGSPRGTVEVDVAGLGLGPIRDGSILFETMLDEDQTTLLLSIQDKPKAKNDPLVYVATRLPLNVSELYGESAPLEELRSALSGETFKLVAVVGRRQLKDLPFTGRLPAPFDRGEVELQAEVSGSISDPLVSATLKGRVPDLLGDGNVPLGVDLDLSNAPKWDGAPTIDRDAVAGRLTLTGGATQIAAGEMTLPGAVPLLLEGGDMQAELYDPELAFELGVALGADELKRVLPTSVSALLLAWVHDPRLVVDLSVSGAPAGPTVESIVKLTEGETERDPERPISFVRELDVAVVVEPDDARVAIALERGAADIEGTPGGTLTLVADLGLGTAKLLDGEIDGSEAITARLRSADYTLGGLELLVPSAIGESKGLLEANLGLTGTLSDAEFDGSIAAHFDTLAITVLGRKETDLRLALEFADGRMRLLPVTLGEPGNQLNLEAELSLPSLDPREMQLSALLELDRFELMKRRDLQIRVDGELELEGTAAAPQGTGRFEVVEGLVLPDESSRDLAPTELPDTIVFVESADADTVAAVRERIRAETEEALAVARAEASEEGDASGESEAIDSAKVLRIETRIEIPQDRLRVRNQFADVFVSGTLDANVVGTALRLGGSVEIDGTVSLYGRTLELTDPSRVLFRPDDSLNPRLQITATYDISDVDLSAVSSNVPAEPKIFVDVSGTVNAPEIALRSNAELDQTNIASILALGQVVGADEESDDEDESGTAMNPGTNLVASLLSGRLASLLTDSLPVDTVQLDARGRLKVGWRPSRNVFIYYVGDANAQDDENANAVEIRWRATNWLNGIARVGDAGRGIVEAVFRFAL